MRKFFLFLIFCFATLNIFAQESAKLRYENGKSLFREGKYALARENFETVLQTENSGGAYAELASYYFALSSLRMGEMNTAKNMYLQILNKYPSWPYIDEVKYGLADAYFQSGNIFEAVEMLRSIKNKNLREEGRNMKMYYLLAVGDLKYLTELLQKYPEDKDLAVLLAERIYLQPLYEQDRNLLDFLVKEYDLDAEKYNALGGLRNVKKDVYEVAVMLPFQSDRFRAGKTRKNFVMDLFEGINIALDSLKRDGVNVKVYAFDTKLDSTHTAKILQSGDLDAMDLIIGPLYEAPFKAVSQFAYDRKINLIHPLSDKVEYISENPFSYLLKSSYVTQAKNAAEYAVQSFDLNKNYMIFYSDNHKDSAMAATYRQTLNEKGFTNVYFKKISVDEIQNSMNFLAEMNDERIFKFKEDSIGHIFLASHDKRLIAKAISTLGIRDEKIPMITTDEIFEISTLSYDQVERLGIRIIASDYVNKNNGTYNSFRKFYINSTGALPSKYTCLGFDMMYYFGKQMGANGRYFQLDNEDNYVEGKLTPAYNYFQANDNKYTSILQFIEARLLLPEQIKDLNYEPINRNK
ncbi:ABC transporter substrate-binding protein [Marinigracilibium pacificum]|uniref:ABC transporter substrate-binding protein n=1 Tax=Marinigracilibium pacificum TaxID=2729599 RepID=A0A848JB49_9BACT|nr:tetratricopeptide repeat protein [Marinigracilibium pacificum]NMM50252.1 ABC transporter substrate-binding protein [Marinigracilibium pacificum]